MNLMLRMRPFLSIAAMIVRLNISTHNPLPIYQKIVIATLQFQKQHLLTLFGPLTFLGRLTLFGRLTLLGCLTLLGLFSLLALLALLGPLTL